MYNIQQFLFPVKWALFSVNEVWQHIPGITMTTERAKYRHKLKETLLDCPTYFLGDHGNEIDLIYKYKQDIPCFAAFSVLRTKEVTRQFTRCFNKITVYLMNLYSSRTLVSCPFPLIFLSHDFLTQPYFPNDSYKLVFFSCDTLWLFTFEFITISLLLN